MNIDQNSFNNLSKDQKKVLTNFCSELEKLGLYNIEIEPDFDNDRFKFKVYEPDFKKIIKDEGFQIAYEYSEDDIDSICNSLNEAYSADYINSSGVILMWNENYLSDDLLSDEDDDMLNTFMGELQDFIDGRVEKIYKEYLKEYKFSNIKEVKTEKISRGR